MNLVIKQKKFDGESYEFCERKGRGHPDTLSDGLAEFLSANYSKYTKDTFGAVLHHNFDKVGLLGGASDVGFGYGSLVKPIRVLLNGRASTSFGDTEIDVKTMLIGWASQFLSSVLPIDPVKDLEFHYNLSNKSSPGKVEKEIDVHENPRKYWFQPRDLADIPELKKLFSNDTSIGVGFAPLSKIENLLLAIEESLLGDDFRLHNPWIGSDIKLAGIRDGDEYKITMCVPQISTYVASIEEYQKNIQKTRTVITNLFEILGIQKYELYINTRDNYDIPELYLTATGSSIESGDEGLVGRGNRIQRIISPMRPMSMEGVAGKNPVYHIGKLYYVAAQKISEKIYDELHIQNEVCLISQSGRDLLDPWIITVFVPENFSMPDKIESIVKTTIREIPKITIDLINQKIPLF